MPKSLLILGNTGSGKSRYISDHFYHLVDQALPTIIIGEADEYQISADEKINIREIIRTYDNLSIIEKEIDFAIGNLKDQLGEIRKDKLDKVWKIIVNPSDYIVFTSVMDVVVPMLYQIPVNFIIDMPGCMHDYFLTRSLPLQFDKNINFVLSLLSITDIVYQGAFPRFKSILLPNHTGYIDRENAMWLGNQGFVLEETNRPAPFEQFYEYKRPLLIQNGVVKFLEAV